MDKVPNFFISSYAKEYPFNIYFIDALLINNNHGDKISKIVRFDDIVKNRFANAWSSIYHIEQFIFIFFYFHFLFLYF